MMQGCVILATLFEGKNSKFDLKTNYIQVGPEFVTFLQTG
jgi:hypothetical protein